jgi:hypothetical protein
MKSGGEIVKSMQHELRAKKSKEEKANRIKRRGTYCMGGLQNVSLLQ